MKAYTATIEYGKRDSHWQENIHKSRNLEELIKNGIKEGDTIELSSVELKDQYGHLMKEKHLWTVVKKYKHVMTVRRRWHNGYVRITAVTYNAYLCEGAGLVVSGF